MSCGSQGDGGFLKVSSWGVASDNTYAGDVSGSTVGLRVEAIRCMCFTVFSVNTYSSILYNVLCTALPLGYIDQQVLSQ
jgi:hypothetical protein